MGEEFYDVGTGLAVPGLEAIIEYGDASKIVDDRIPGAMLINDRSGMEWVRLSSIDGLHGDPDGRDTRAPKADQDGEDAGIMRYGGRTIGLTGDVEAGSIPAVRDLWSRFSSQFGKRERDLLIHPSGEVSIRSNLLLNPAFRFTGSFTDNGWAAIATGLSMSTGEYGFSPNTLGSAEVGHLQVNLVHNNTGSASVFSDEARGLVPWDGEDVFLMVDVSTLNVFSPMVVSSISLGLKEYVDDGITVAHNSTGGAAITNKTTQASPVVNQVYSLWIRVPATSIAPTTRYINLDVTVAWTTTTTSGGFSVNLQNAVLALLDHGDVTPTFYFGDAVPGYESDDIPHLSSSRGPLYDVNMVPDPEFVNVSTTGLLANWFSRPTTGVTVTSGPLVDPRWRGAHVGSSGYVKLTKDNSSTSRVMSFGPKGPDSVIGITDNYFPVFPGRRYRWSMLVNLLQKPASGTVGLTMNWRDASSLISSSTVALPSVGVNTVSVTAVAPAHAIRVEPVLTVTTTTANGVLETSVSDPCLVDITEHDSGDFFGLEQYEVRADPSRSQLARRRIVRPFLIKNVRKTSDAKASEQQQDRRYRRPFTMSLRAADPRIYVLDERRASIQMTGFPSFVAVQSPDGFTLETGGLPVPSGFTYEGNYITHPGVGTTYKWSREATEYGSSAYQHLLGGVGVKAWDSFGAFNGNDPAQDLVTRVYRSNEGFTYGEPRVVIGGAPSGYGYYSSSPPVDWRGMAVQYRGSSGSRTFHNNDLTILLKRVLSSVWIELRWTSWEHAFPIWDGVTNTVEPGAPYAFELWCSNNASGTHTTTRLAGWDYASKPPSGLYPFRPLYDPMWLVSWISNNVVYWELRSTYPSVVNSTGVVESGSYALPSALQSILGSAVAGYSGWSTRIGTGAGGDVFPPLASVPPFIHYYEQSDSTTPQQAASMPVIGSIETPQVIELRGDLVDPIVQVVAPEFDGEPSSITTAWFSGTIFDSSPIYIDLRDSSIRDGFGQNRRDLLVPGSRFQMFRPGVNQVTIQAKNWGDYPAHLITSWRDAV